MGTWIEEIDVAGRWIRRNRVRRRPDLTVRSGEEDRRSRWERASSRGFFGFTCGDEEVF
jgi:hypothetical protein